MRRVAAQTGAQAAEPNTDALFRRLEAGRLAAAKTSRRALAGALYAVLGEPTPAGAIGLADFSGARVDRLFDPRSELPPITTRRRIIISVAGATLLGVVLAFPVHLDVGESTDLRSMLTSMSLHGLRK